MLVQTPEQFVVPAGQPPHVPWLQNGVDAEQVYPHAPQLWESEFRSVHVPLQQVVPVAQQV
jgi:hypothetical protein